MARLENLTTGTRVTGLTASGSATVESAQWIGEQGLKVIYRDADGGLGERFVYRDDEPSLELVGMGRPWSFDGDGDLLRLVSEAYRINFAWLFDPSVLDPVAVGRRPLRAASSGPSRRAAVHPAARPSRDEGDPGRRR